jgi:cytochrome c oxidase assembly factor 1
MNINLGSYSVSCYSVFLSGNMVSNKTLAKIAAYGGVVVVSTGLLAHWKVQKRLKDSEFHKEAMKILRNHPPSVSLLGEPIKSGNVDVGNTSANVCDATHAQLEVPVKGPRNKGTLFLRAERVNPEQKWNVYRMELGLKKDPNRRFVIKNDSPETTSDL